MADRIRHRTSPGAASFLALAACAAISSTAFAQASLTYHPSTLRVYGASADGSTVYGTESTSQGVQVFVLKNGVKTNVVQTGGRRSFPIGISGDGNTLVGTGDNSLGVYSDFVWTAGEATAQPVFDDGRFYSVAGISQDGSTIVGYHYPGSYPVGFALRNGVEHSLDPGAPVFPSGVSADGTVVFGSAYPDDYSVEFAFVWRVGESGLTPVPVGAAGYSYAWKVSNDNSTVVGSVGDEFGSTTSAFVWRIGAPTVSYIDVGGGYTDVYDVSADGQTVVGSAPVYPGGKRGWVWRSGATTVLEPTPGLIYSEAYVVSADGTRVVGNASKNAVTGPEYDSKQVVVWDLGAEPKLLSAMLAESGVIVGPAVLRDILDLSADGTKFTGTSFLRTASGDVYGGFSSTTGVEEPPPPPPAPTPTELIEKLAGEVAGSNVGNMKNPLLAKLAAALAAIDLGDPLAASIAVESFRNQVSAQSGKKIPVAVAEEWIAAAEEIIDLLLE